PAMLLRVETRLGRLSFLGATTVFGTPADVTLEEIALEALYPADAFTDKTVRAAAAAAPEATPATVLPSPSLRATSRPAARWAESTSTPAGSMVTAVPNSTAVPLASS